MVQLAGLGGRRERAVPAEAVQHHLPDRPRPEPAVLAAEARVRAGRDPEHGLRDAVHQRSARPARGRHRPLRAAGASRCEGTAVSGCGRSRRPGCSGCLPTTTPRSRPRRRTSASRPPFAYALDYPSFVRLAGPGAIQARGIIPSMFLGALPASAAVSRNLTRARSELAASGVGGQTFTLEYPSDLTINGVAFATLAQRVQANLQDIGVKVELAGRARRHVAGQVPRRDDGVRPVAVGTGLPRPGRLPRLHAGRARRRARRLAEGRRPGARAARRNGARHDERPRSGADLRRDPDAG